MALLPQLQALSQQPYLTNSFAGYNHNPVIGDGEMYEMTNLTSDKYPLLSPRKRRSVYMELDNDPIDFFRFAFADGMHDVLIYIDEYEEDDVEHRGLFIRRDDEEAEMITELVHSDVVTNHLRTGAQVVLMMRSTFARGLGTTDTADLDYVLIYNLLDKKLEDTRLFGAGITGIIHDIVPCPEGAYDNNVTRSVTEPSNPQDGDYWLRMYPVTYSGVSFYTYEALRYMSGGAGMHWIDFAGAYVQIRVDVNNDDEKNKVIAVLESGQKLSIRGLKCGYTETYPPEPPPHNQYKIQEQLDAIAMDFTPTGYHMHTRTIEHVYPQTMYIHAKPPKGLNFGIDCVGTGGNVMNATIAKAVPIMDYVCESNNRVWGCRYGLNNGEVVNEVYASALGKPGDFYLFEGTNADSWAASIGTDGPFTGCIHWSDTVLFFKEKYMHRVGGNMPSAFGITTLECRGVQDGSWRSLAVVDERVYYKSVRDIMMYDGSLPQSVSEALGETIYSAAVGGRYRDCYYISMLDPGGEPSLFVYNTRLGMWHRHDDLPISTLVDTQETLYAISGEEIIDLMGNGSDLEDALDWEAVFGISGYEYTGDSANISRYNSYTQGYLSRYNIRMRLDRGSSLHVWLMYDSDGVWRDYGEIVGRGDNLRSFTVPVSPRRCDHCRLRLTGHGGAEIYSIARIYTSGGDGVPRT